MFHLFKIAYRNLFRNHRRTLLTILAIGSAVALLIFMSGVTEGELQGALDVGIRLQTGHIQIREESYEEEKNSLLWKDLLKNPDDIIGRANRLDSVRAATPYLWTGGILTVGDESVNVRVIGMEPESEVNAPFREALVSGDYLMGDDRDKIYIGQRLADSLNIASGHTLSLILTDANGQPVEAIFTVCGLYNTGAPTYDETTVFLPLSKTQSLTATENHASAITMLLHDQNQSEGVAQSLRAPDNVVKTWQEMNSFILQSVELSDAYMGVLNAIVLAVGASVIVNTLLMSVFERMREIGILTAIGMKGRQVLALFLIETTLIGIAGSILGIAVGSLIVWYYTVHGIYIGDIGATGIIFTDTIYAQFSPDGVISVTVMGLAITLLGGLYPAYIAARMESVDALHQSE
ncbi:MAG: ABC transporter permease [Chloroflexi bacterium]|nr:ABC transporter permease [Chloroflexota bacterium]